MPKPFVQISIEWAGDISAPEIGRGFIEALCRETLLAPQQLGFADEFTSPYRGVEDFVASWWATDAEVGIDGGPMHAFKTGPYWRRRAKPASQGFVKHDMGVREQRPTSYVWLRGTWDQRIDYERLFRDWLALAPADIGMLHLFAGPDLAAGDRGDSGWFQTGSFGGPMKPGLPNIGWGMAYGEGHAGEVDAEAIRDAGVSVERLDDVWLVRVTDRLPDVVEDFGGFSRRRAELKACFRPDLFWITDEPV